MKPIFAFLKQNLNILKFFYIYLHLIIITLYPIVMKRFDYRFLLTACLVLLFSQLTISQNDLILLQRTGNGSKQFQYTVKDGQTLFSISRNLQVDIAGLVRLNPLKAIGKLSVGDTLLLPNVAMTPKSQNIPIVHIIQCDQSIYQLKRNFHTSIADLKAMNPEIQDQCRVGDQIILGYLHKPKGKTPKPTPPSTKNSSASAKSKSYTLGDLKTELFSNEDKAPVAQNSVPERPLTNPTEKIETANTKEIISTNNAMTWKDRFLQANALIPARSDQGVALWIKESQINGVLYVLHPTAPLNSIIEVTNPAFNRTVYGKVIGNIPANVYPSEVKLIMTPSFAKALGAVDQRFFVKLKYQPGRNS